MIYISDINKLLSLWTDRMSDPRQPQAYKDGVSDCIYELSSLVRGVIEEEMIQLEKDEKSDEQPEQQQRTA